MSNILASNFDYAWSVHEINGRTLLKPMAHDMENFLICDDLLRLDKHV